MNYIKRLQSENEIQAQEIERLNQGLSDLRSYMCSEKFHVDTTVQTSDILRWIEQIKSGRLI
jgi:hypothetical protein